MMTLLSSILLGAASSRAACAQFAPHSNVKGDQFAIREPKVAHNRVFAAESELVLRVTGE